MSNALNLAQRGEGLAAPHAVEAGPPDGISARSCCILPQFLCPVCFFFKMFHFLPAKQIYATPSPPLPPPKKPGPAKKRCPNFAPVAKYLGGLKCSGWRGLLAEVVELNYDVGVREWGGGTWGLAHVSPPIRNIKRIGIRFYVDTNRVHVKK